MFAPKLYTTYKFKFRYLQENNFDLHISEEELHTFEIKQQDNLLFHQIRRIANCTDECGRYVIFVDAKGCAADVDGLTRLVVDGVSINGKRYVIGERSASMTRNSILSLADATIADELADAITMGSKPGPTVLSKLMAYRGLALSSCHCLGEYVPKIIIVPDYETVIPNQHIKYLYDKESVFKNADGEDVHWKQKDIADDVRDIKITPFDGCGIHHPAITDAIRTQLGAEDWPTTILWRGPYLKGVTSEMDYVGFYKERGISHIKDVWGVEHDVTEDGDPMVIMSESMYKGLKYFAINHDATDWRYYWQKFYEYGHCLGVAKWNFDIDTEPVYTRCNYQVLQTLDMPRDDFEALADTSIDWATRIMGGDRFFTMCFLGLTADRLAPMNDYVRAVLKNPVMLEEQSVRNYLASLLEKYINDMKCGKVWIKSRFKFLVPDLIAFMEAAAELPVVGCLEADEFFCFDRGGAMVGEKLITRNPHICESENIILRGIDSPLTQRYMHHLVNCCVINIKSITPQRLNGADFDGDLVLVFEDDRVLKGVNRDAVPVIDVDDKITTAPEEFIPENKLKIILRTMKNLIGEYSNYATAFQNKQPQTKEQLEKYKKYIDIISVLTGKSIDYAKTGVLYPMPRMISKYGRPLPYFMKYASPYYARQKLAMTKSNMNYMCWDIERWEKQMRWKRRKSNFDWTVMMDDSVEMDEKTVKKVDDIYRRFCNDVKELAKMLAPSTRGTDEMSELYGACYESYRAECHLVCPDKKKLANIVVYLSYVVHKTWNRKFMWLMAGNGIVENITQVSIELPERSDDGEMEYLGRRYNMVRVEPDAEVLKEAFK